MNDLVIEVMPNEVLAFSNALADFIAIQQQLPVIVF
jgi:hypothetical protein